MKQSAKILIVDDRVENLVALEKVFAGLDAEIIRATSGREALAKTLDHDFALALVDVQMPDMDGFETVSLMRRQKRTRYLPVIFISAIFFEDYYLVKGIETGAVDFITKPFNPRVLLGKVSVYLAMYRQRMLLEEARDNLEETVRRRTEKLKNTNERLQREIIEREKIEKALKGERDRAEHYLNIAGAILLALGPAGTVNLINKKGCDVLGYPREDIIGRDWFDNFLPEAARDEARAVFSGLMAGVLGRNEYYESPVLNNSGERIRILWHNSLLRDDSGEVVGTLSSGEDITERKKLEAQLQQAQKMEAVGQLAGGVAHDFNNILAVIINYGHVMLMKPVSEEQHRIVEKILSSADRGARLTTSLLAFSRKQVMQAVPVRPNELVGRVEKLISRIIGEQIAVRTVSTGKDPVIMADSTQIEQVLLNLATNARDAMPGGGELTLETDEVEMDEEYIRMHGYGKAGRYAVISVSDTGRGMDEDTRKKIFEPFFTTKEVDKGTGLGMAMSYGIIKQHGGFINVYSEPGNGTSIKIYLPAGGEERQETEAPLPADSPATGGETVLLAEDDEELRAVTMQILAGHGYTVIEAADGQEVVERFRENRDRIDLLVLDAIMPNKGGRAAYDEIRTERPGIKVLFLSGYTTDTIVRNGFLEQGLNFISKPVAPAKLLKKIRGILDE
ncbi:MAG: response regulator [Desulfobacterales bacterium]|nr:response regulator [Desulfobacterales bacterium]